MFRRSLLGIVASMLVSVPALAQTGSITGTVTSIEGGVPIPGAQVRVLGTRFGDITGDDGRFAIALEAGTYTVRVSRIGFAPDSLAGLAVSSGAVTTANFQLRSTPAQLENVVVVGYGTQEARDRTGVVDAISAEEFNTGRVVSPEQLIQAKVAGVNVIDTGEPGGGITVRIRGGTSVTSSNEPLFVIDGVPLPVGGGISTGRNALNFLNPADIETMTVLKDASATAIYGSRGANGVIMITTKSGATGPAVTYGSSVSISEITKEPSLLSVDQFRAAVAEHAPSSLPLLGAANTDWRGEVTQTGIGHEHNVAVSGSREDLNYRMSLSYLDQEGIIKGSAVDRLTGSVSYSDLLFNDRLSLKANFKGSRTKDTFTPSGVLGSATAFAPTQPIRTQSGSFFEWANTIGTNNPIAELELVSDEGIGYRSVGNIQGDYTLPWIPDLKATLSLGYDVAKAERTGFFPSVVQAQIEAGSNGTFTRNNPTLVNLVLDAYGTYNRRLESVDSDIELTGGYSYEDSDGDYPGFIAQGLSSDLLGPHGVPAAEFSRNFLFVDESKLVSFFGRANYTLQDKYLLTVSVRRDGSSKFGEGNQWGTFPSAAAAWRISEEPFAPRFFGLSDLKLRLSYGVNGNQAFPNYQAFSTYLISTAQAQVQFGNEFVNTIRPGAADPNIKWEETESYNVGLDFGFLENRLNGSMDYYHKKTKDLIFNVPVAAGTNLSNFVTTNIGNLENDGFEFTLGGTVIEGPPNGFSWNANFNAAWNSNEITRINPFGGGSDQVLVGGIAGGVGSTIQVLMPGQPINSFFVYRHIRGPDGKPLYADTDGSGTITDKDLYEDLNGDGEITQADRRPFKSPAPKWILGFSNNMTFRKFDGGFTLRAHLGNYVYNNVASNLGHFSAVRGQSPSNLHTSVLETEFVNPQYFSDVYVEDASFLRLENITLGYTLGNLRAVKQLRIFGTIQNLFTITGYSGLDPTAVFNGTDPQIERQTRPFTGNVLNGIDNNIYPRSRTYTFGMSAGL
ncbi:MAG TPA: SusC/RagA family TonB-linked outer membrane protein [Gemmatimonadaceae bacterium]|nr:SusC/RagA family TonB-linked outer membrane protein [Gemmatimonadaceae bacterium]